MYSKIHTKLDKTPTGKAPKGQVVVIESNGRLQLRFRVNGKRHYLSTGYPDTPTYRKLAESRAKLVQSDIDLDRFDPTLDKYKRQTTTVADDSVNEEKISLIELWERYTDFRKPQIAETTLRIQYAAVENHLRKLPNPSLDAFLEIRDFWLKTLTLDTVRRTITQISACCEWAVESGLILENPFRGMAKKIKVTRSKKTQGEFDDIDPFTKEERDAIIQAFEESQWYSYYAPFVKFLFLTGCRTGEAIALKWKHVSRDCGQIHFCESVSTQLKVRKETKTKKSRKFPCNQQLQQLLKSIRPTNPDPEALVFPAKRGSEINSRHFIQHAWKGGRNRKEDSIKDGIVMQLVKEGRVERYRTQYNTRHSFISYCLESGISAVQIAKWVGNSSATIVKHYWGVTNQAKVPDL